MPLTPEAYPMSSQSVGPLPARRRQPFPDQADDSTISDPIFDEAHQPFSAELIEERLDVGVENPADLACLDPVCEGIQRIVLAASRTEPIAETQELRHVNRRKDSHHCRLEDFVLNRGNAERLVAAIRLRYKPPTGWQRSIRSGMDPCVKITETSLKILLVLIPRHPINTRSRALLQAEERPPENIDVDVVQE